MVEQQASSSYLFGEPQNGTEDYLLDISTSIQLVMGAIPSSVLRLGIQNQFFSVVHKYCISSSSFEDFWRSQNGPITVGYPRSSTDSRPTIENGFLKGRTDHFLMLRVLLHPEKKEWYDFSPLFVDDEVADTAISWVLLKLFLSRSEEGSVHELVEALIEPEFLQLISDNSFVSLFVSPADMEIMRAVFLDLLMDDPFQTIEHLKFLYENQVLSLPDQTLAFWNFWLMDGRAHYHWWSFVLSQTESSVYGDDIFIDTATPEAVLLRMNLLLMYRSLGIGLVTDRRVGTVLQDVASVEGNVPYSAVFPVMAMIANGDSTARWEVEQVQRITDVYLSSYRSGMSQEELLSWSILGKSMPLESGVVDIGVLRQSAIEVNEADQRLIWVREVVHNYLRTSAYDYIQSFVVWLKSGQGSDLEQFQIYAGRYLKQTGQSRACCPPAVLLTKAACDPSTTQGQEAEQLRQSLLGSETESLLEELAQDLRQYLYASLEEVPSILNDSISEGSSLLVSDVLSVDLCNQLKQVVSLESGNTSSVFALQQELEQLTRVRIQLRNEVDQVDDAEQRVALLRLDTVLARVVESKVVKSGHLLEETSGDLDETQTQSQIRVGVEVLLLASAHGNLSGESQSGSFDLTARSINSFRIEDPLSVYSLFRALEFDWNTVFAVWKDQMDVFGEAMQYQVKHDIRVVDNRRLFMNRIRDPHMLNFYKTSLLFPMELIVSVLQSQLRRVMIQQEIPFTQSTVLHSTSEQDLLLDTWCVQRFGRKYSPDGHNSQRVPVLEQIMIDGQLCYVELVPVPMGSLGWSVSIFVDSHRVENPVDFVKTHLSKHRGSVRAMRHSLRVGD